MLIAAKVYNKSILNRIMLIVDQILRENQAGFEKGVAVPNNIIEGALARKLPLFITFIDFKKAFDSINRTIMFAILRHYGILDKVEVLYEDSSSRVLLDGKISEEFKLSTGVLQGDVLAPFLFIIVIDYVMKNSVKDYGFITHPRRSSRLLLQRLNDLDYVENIALFEVKSLT